MNLTVYLGLNVEFYGPRGQTGFSYPLLPLTGLVAGYYRLKSKITTLARQINTVASVISIGANALKFGLAV